MKNLNPFLGQCETEALKIDWTFFALEIKSASTNIQYLSLVHPIILLSLSVQNVGFLITPKKSSKNQISCGSLSNEDNKYLYSQWYSF